MNLGGVRIEDDVVTPVLIPGLFILLLCFKTYLKCLKLDLKTTVVPLRVHLYYLYHYERITHLQSTFFF